MITLSDEAPQRWILRRTGLIPELRLFCFSYAGGNASLYLPWQKAFAPQVEVCAIQLPGRGARFGEPLLQDIGSAVRAIAHAITPLMDRPFAFFGHSLGALLAYELAHFQKERNAPLPFHLVVSGAESPRMRRIKRQLHLLEDADLALELERYAGTPTEILENSELLSLVLPIVRADFRMACEYTSRPRPPLPIPLTVFAGRDDTYDDVIQYQDWFNDSSAGAELHWFDGGHFFINSSTEQVLNKLNVLMAQALHTEHVARHA